ncbi:MAG: HAMP domain-containing sensor histidine kinase [Gemmatimonadota bacterium]
MIEELNRLRIRLTAWYVGVFALVLLTFGAALLAVLSHQISARLDASLADAAHELAGATLIRQREGPAAPGHADALDELRIPDRTLYVFDMGGALVHPDTAAAWIRALADSGRAGPVYTRHELSESVTWRAFARPFALPDGRQYVAVAAADVVEVDDEYAGLLLAFSLAALVALAVVGLGGWWVARRSTEPVRDSFQRMRNFMADAAHELRTPAAVVAGHAEVALRQPREAREYAQILGAIHGEAVRLSGILENLLTIARADAGAWPVRHEPLYLDDLLLDVTENAGALASAKGVTLEVVALDELPVRGDPDLLRQLVMILLDNAVKFSPVGEQVRVAGRRTDGRGRIEVEDCGPGIPPDVLPHVFDRFYRGDPAHGRAMGNGVEQVANGGEKAGGTRDAGSGAVDRSASPGAGLGLSIARWIADVHGASIALDSEPGRGTRAVVSFPLEEES